MSRDKQINKLTTKIKLLVQNTLTFIAVHVIVSGSQIKELKRKVTIFNLNNKSMRGDEPYALRRTH